MMYLDSWVWLSYFVDDRTAKKVERLLYLVESGQKAVCSTIGLTEVLYIIHKKAGKQVADRIRYIMKALKGVVFLPVTEEVAVMAAGMREKYYHRNQRPFSYADAIHLATAVLAGCETFYSGDPYFKGIDEIKIELIDLRFR